MPFSPAARPLSTPAEWATAVGAVEGPQLVLAGPGTGKTEFLARRVAHLLSRGLAPEAILVLTFSRRAASELEHRILTLLDRPAAGATASTFHSFAHRLVEMDLVSAGLEPPILLTGPEQVRLVAELLEEEDRGRWPVMFRPLLTTATFAAEVADFLMRCRERLIDPLRLEAVAAGRDDWRALPQFLSTYGGALERRNRIDYASLIARSVDIASTTSLTDQYEFVMVDEFQDTSPAQARLAEQAAVRTGNITVAADPHQSIYSFRGAELDNVVDYPGRLHQLTGSEPTTYQLTTSFRVPAAILESAGRLVSGNRPSPLPINEIRPAPHRGAVEVYTFDQRSAEAEWIASEVERIHVADKMPLRSMAVLVRSTRHLLPELSRALDRRHLRHDRPNTRLIDHPAVRLVHDIVTAATSATAAAETERAIRRILLGPLLSIPLGRERELVRRQRHEATPWPDLLAEEIPTAGGLARLLTDDSWARSLPAVDGFWHLWDNLSGVEQIVADPARRDYRAAWSTFARMLERQAERDASVSLIDYLDAAAGGDFEASPLLRFSQPDDDRLVVTTLHQAKGLEFEVVFIADAVEGVFPDTRRSRSLLRPELLARPDAPVELRLEEERRLAYTASTRARRRVVWTATTAGIDEANRRPSRFLLAAAGATTFEAIAAPPALGDAEGFDPVTIADAQARLRRLVADPSANTVERMAALAVVAGPAAPWSAGFFAGVPEPGPDTGMLPAQIRLSPSQATSYDDCPRRYALERRLRAVEADSPYLLFGSIIHETLERAEKEARAMGLTHADMDISRRHLTAVWERDGRFGTPTVNEAWLQRAIRLLDQIYSDWPGGEAPAIELEMELATTLGGVEWTGRADRIDHADGGIKIVDYKTSKTPIPVKEAARSLQLGYYLLAAADDPRLAALGEPTAAELWFPLAQTVRSFDMARLTEVRDRLIEVSQGVVSEDWTPRVSPNCGRCSVKTVCPAWPDGREAYR